MTEKQLWLPGSMGFVPKPVNESVLFGLLEELLGLKPIFATANGTQADFQGTEDALSRPLTEEVPNIAQLDELLPLASLGDVIALRAGILKLSAEEPALRTFCRRISILAEKYQMSGVEKILEAAREKASRGKTGRARELQEFRLSGAEMSLSRLELF